MLFREREVDNLMTLIYGNSAAQEEESEEDEDAIDCNRYYAAAEKLSMYKDPSVKRKLKSKLRLMQFIKISTRKRIRSRLWKISLTRGSTIFE